MALGCSLLPAGGFLHAARRPKKVLVLGIDGMDVHLTRQYMQQGLMPNFRKVMQAGGLLPMQTSMPPQSPVAWSHIAVGGGTHTHGIYDFIHRHPASMRPYLSTSRVRAPSRVLHMGPYRLPLGAGKTENLRKGRPFWDYLVERDVPTTLFKMPANFPCEESPADMVSGMGTPDLRGGYGNFTLYTSAPQAFVQNTSGGRIETVHLKNHHFTARLSGPANTLVAGQNEASVPLQVWRDATGAVARIRLQDHELVLNQGEWSGWLQLRFPMVGPLVDVKGMVKLFVKQVHPDFHLYISPINIDPTDPALPVASSETYTRELVQKAGLFYTQGFPEDTKALSDGILDEDEYLRLAQQVLIERQRLLEVELERFDRIEEGFSFFYFSSLDQNSHMYWRSVDPQHPLFSPELKARYGKTLKSYYGKFDEIMGRILSRYDIHDPQFTLMVLSDHGFAPFRRQVNVNSWLLEKGYMNLGRRRAGGQTDLFGRVDWSQTSAYNLGINALYLNVAGREKDGVLAGSQVQRVRKKLQDDLLAMRDPQTGHAAVREVRVISEDEHRKHAHAPDLIIGWNMGFRTSWDSILGGFSKEVFSDNLDKWSGDHCIAPGLVPAIMVTNKPMTLKAPRLANIAPTILKEFDISPAGEMQKQGLFG